MPFKFDQKSLTRVEEIRREVYAYPDCLPPFVGFGPDYEHDCNCMLHYLNQFVNLSPKMLHHFIEEYLDNVLFEDGDNLIPAERFEETVKIESILSYHRNFVSMRYNHRMLFYIIFQNSPLIKDYLSQKKKEKEIIFNDSDNINKTI